MDRRDESKSSGPADADGEAPAVATSPESYPFRHEVDVRFRDLDSMGHAHHTLPLVYFEEARGAFWREVSGAATPDDVGYVLGEVSVRYHARIRYPARVSVGVRLASIGNASFALEYSAWSEGGDLLASGRTTQVMYDVEREASVPVPDAVRKRLREVAGDQPSSRLTPTEASPISPPST